MARKKNAFELHKENECGCSVLSNPNNCIYQQFLDGWNFTPDVGNGQKRGEVFTPRWVVDKMILDVGMFPKSAVYEFNYETLNKTEKLEKISSKVVEPAVGTGNYISTVLWHKLQYAYSAALTVDNSLNVSEYHINFLSAVSSIYAFDIDCGNLEITKRRILGNDNLVNNEKTVLIWTNKLNSSFVDPVSESLQNIEINVQASLNEAFTNWHKSLEENNYGIIKTLYKEHTGKEITETLFKSCETILNDNIKLFNGIVKDDVIDDKTICPGYKNVVWRWWDISISNDGNYELNFEEVRLLEQMITGEIELLEKKVEKLKTEKMTETDEGLFSMKVWADKASETEHNKIVKQIAKLKKELSN